MRAPSKQVFVVLFLGTLLFGFACGGVIEHHRILQKIAPKPILRDDPKSYDSKLVQLSTDLSRMQRMDYMDSCRGIGWNCTRAEECCTLQCLKRTHKCIM